MTGCAKPSRWPIALRAGCDTEMSTHTSIDAPDRDGLAAPRRLIVNADDFGQSAGINDGIIRSYVLGVVTSASLMVRWPSAPAAAAYARAEPVLSVGLHLDLGEWIYGDRGWVPLYQVVPLDDPAAIREEVLRQLETFQLLMRSDPTHIDSHQHVHGRALVRDVVAEIGNRLGIPVRHGSTRIKHLGEFYGQGPKGSVLNGAITVDRLIALLGALADGTTEMSCHPGLRCDAYGMYVADREEEVHVLCDPRIRAAIEAERIELISFRHLA
jgi:hypothetical protein